MRARDNVENTAGPGEVRHGYRALYFNLLCFAVVRPGHHSKRQLPTSQRKQRAVSGGKAGQRVHHHAIPRIKMASKGSRVDNRPGMNQDDSSCSRTCAHGCAGISILEAGRSLNGHR